VTHKISFGLFYNSHQWLTNDPSQPSGNWIWFWLGLFDEHNTTVSICRQPPFAQHITANVITVSNTSSQRENRVFAGNHDILFDAFKPWVSSRSNYTYYTQHRFRIVPAGLDLYIESFVKDSEFGYRSFGSDSSPRGVGQSVSPVYYYEGAGNVWGTQHGKPVYGVGNIETFGGFYTDNPAKYPPK